MSLRYKFGYIHEVCFEVRDDGDGLCSQADQMLLAKIEVMENFISENRKFLSEKMPAGTLSTLLKDTYK